MSAAAAAIGKAAALILGEERGRKAVGWVLTAILSPLILLIVIVCSIGSGSAGHNNAAADACFYGTALPASVPAEYQTHIAHMRTAFTRLDAAVTEANSSAEDGGLDATYVKAAFFALCFGDAVPSNREAGSFAGCFYTTEKRTRTVETTDPETGEVITEEEEYSVTVLVSSTMARANLTALLGREITENDLDNIQNLYQRIAGPVGSAVSGSYLLGSSSGTALDVPLRHPNTKNAEDLAIYATFAWENRWGYVWGTFGYVMTPSFLDVKAAQYPTGVGDKREMIESLWMGRRTTDCCGLIKSYGWYDSETQSIVYASHGMPDVAANQMYYAATESGPIDTIPEIPGLAVWQDGHIGVYIGNGEVIEAAGTDIGVIKTQLGNRTFTHWLKVAYIDYD